MLKQYTFMVELAGWLAKQEHLVDTDEQIACLRQIIQDLTTEQQKQRAHEKSHEED